jgi:hypothetical protein
MRAHLRIADLEQGFGDHFARCKGLFYACAGGAEARHFNRMLIDAGLIKNL